MSRWKWWVLVAVLAVIGAVVKDKASQKSLKNAQAQYKASCLKAVTAQSSMLSSQADNVCECSAKATVAQFGANAVQQAAEKPTDANVRAMMDIMVTCMDTHAK